MVIIKYSDGYEELELIGRGTFGHVFKVRDKSDGNLYAVKVMHIENELLENYSNREINENNIHSHTHLIKCHRIWTEFLPQEPVKVFIQMELCYSDFEKWIENRNKCLQSGMFQLSINKCNKKVQFQVSLNIIFAHLIIIHNLK